MRALLVHQGMNEALGEASSSKKVRKVSYENISNVMDIGYGVMILSLRNGVLIEIGNEMIATGLQKRPEDMYTKESMAKRLVTKKKLYIPQMKEGSSKINDKNKTMIILCSLPSSYEHRVDTLMYMW